MLDRKIDIAKVLAVFSIPANGGAGSAMLT
jgi:hypothetical protein